jgi:hypothetical protein
MQAKEKTKTARIDISSQPKIIGPFIDGKKLMVSNAVTEALYQYINS